MKKTTDKSPIHRFARLAAPLAGLVLLGAGVSAEAHDFSSFSVRIHSGYPHHYWRGGYRHHGYYPGRFYRHHWRRWHRRRAERRYWRHHRWVYAPYPGYRPYGYSFSYGFSTGW